MLDSLHDGQSGFFETCFTIAFISCTAVSFAASIWVIYMAVWSSYKAQIAALQGRTALAVSTSLDLLLKTNDRIAYLFNVALAFLCLAAVLMAAKHLESAGFLARDLKEAAKAAQLYEQAAKFHEADGRRDNAAEAYCKAARVLEGADAPSTPPPAAAAILHLAFSKHRPPLGRLPLRHEQIDGAAAFVLTSDGLWLPGAERWTLVSGAAPHSAVGVVVDGAELAAYLERVVAYAHARGVAVLPEIDTPSHSKSLCAGAPPGAADTNALASVHGAGGAAAPSASALASRRCAPFNVPKPPSMMCGQRRCCRRAP